MRVILILWLIPVVLFWGWYGLSANNMHFGWFFLTRGFHDHLFVIYGNILHMPPEEVPEKLAWVFGIDTVIVFGIAALRWYKKWLPQSWNWFLGLIGRGPEKTNPVLRIGRLEDGNAVIGGELIGPVQPAK